MICIHKRSTDPFFNIAAEEFVVKNIDDEVFMLWENTDCLVVGKHQNTIAEINFPFVNTHHIPVLRRISGGGTVFQGSGNMNYSFVTHVRESENKVDFEKATAPLVHFLKTLGVEAKLSGKSSLTIGNKKISGNAAHLHRGTILHHGTLLFDANLDLVNESIHVVHGKYSSKAIASNRAEITNVRPFLRNDMDLTTFVNRFEAFVKQEMGIVDERTFTSDEHDRIAQLVNEKYQLWEWNYGYSPDYSYFTELKLLSEVIPLQIFITKGRIVKIESTDQSHLIEELKRHLLGLRVEKNHLESALLKNISGIHPIFANQLALQLL